MESLLISDDEDVHEIYNNLRKRKRKRMQDLLEEDEFLYNFIVAYPLYRYPSLFRKRWDCQYLLELANKENSFIAEYRLNNKCFDILHNLLQPMLEVDQRMASISMARTKSQPISTASRLGAALIMLGGGRRIEAMRTHGMARTTVYNNFRTVIRAINSHPSLTIKCDNSLTALVGRAKGFEMRSEHSLISY